MNITITGNLGSGKTSVCKELKKMGFVVVSAGDIFRDIAAEKGMTVLELNEAAKKDRSVDDMLDERSANLGKQLDRTVFDSRLAWHFVENSFKIFLLADTWEAAKRVFNGGSRDAEEYGDVDATAEGLKIRAELERERFLDLYGINYYDAGNYDLIIDSSHASPEQISQEIIRNFELYQTEPFETKIELNLQSLYLWQSLKDIDMQQLQAYVGQEQNENQSLCASVPVDIAMDSGHAYVIDGKERTLAALAAGKVFTNINKIQMGHSVPDKEKAGYMINFSNIYTAQRNDA